MVTIEETGTVVVGNDEKGGIKWPQGWADPNVGWNQNDTLAKKHLLKLVNTFNPTLIVWNHDWAAPQSIVKLYNGSGKSEFESLSHIEALLGKYYPSKTIFGKAWPFLVHANVEEDSENMTWPLFEHLGIPSYIIEQYMFKDEAPLLHAVTTLHLLLQHSGADPELLNGGKVLLTVQKSIAAEV